MWLIGLTVALLVSIIAIRFVDDALAQFVHRLPWSSSLRSPTLGLPILVALAGIIVVVGAIWQANRLYFDTLIAASFSLAWSLCVVELLLKPIFGRQTPDEYIQSGRDSFLWLQGSVSSSFPSGHAAQIVSVGAVFLLHYPKYKSAWLAIMGFGLMALVLGNWHFVSDIVLGAAIGAVGASATTSLWGSRSMR